MRDTKVVFMGMGILLLLPILFFTIRCIIRYKDGEKPGNKYLNLGFLGVLALLVVLLVFKVYSFTLKYQAPLAAESYITSEGQDELQEMGIDPDKSQISLSENIYENDDGTTTMYFKFETGDEEIFTVINMDRDGDGWKVTGLERIENDGDKYPEIKKRFFPLKEKKP